MKPYNELTRIGRLRRARQLANQALPVYGMGDAKLTFLRYFANITYRIDLTDTPPERLSFSPYLPGRFLLRILLSNNWDYALGEMTWLAALSREGGLPVPAPVSTLDGELLVRVHTPGMPAGRMISVMRWLDGHKLKTVLSSDQYRAWGEMLGRMHAFSSTWQPPENFRRFVWDWEGLLGGRDFSWPPDRLVNTMPDNLKEPFRHVSDKARLEMAEMGNGPDAFGMIHGDMYPDNVLEKAGEFIPIDFEDCGFGYWLWDIGAALSTSPWTEAWYRKRDDFLEGYLQFHPLPESQLKHLDLFIAIQFAAGVLWASQFIQDEPARRIEHEAWREENGEGLLTFLKLQSPNI